MTSPPGDDPEALRRILGQAEALFLDFDGPICDVFAGIPAPAIVDQLCVILADGGYGEPPAYIQKSPDPFDVFKYAATLGETEARYVESALTAHEVDAISTALPTPSGHELMRAWFSSGRPLAIVSNNSRQAVGAYLDLHGLRPYVAFVSAREVPNPALLKPSPYLLKNAAMRLGVAAQSVVLVGDSMTDVEAANSIYLAAIAYVNKPEKIRLLSSIEVKTVITSIEILTSVVSTMVIDTGLFS